MSGYSREELFENAERLGETGMNVTLPMDAPESHIEAYRARRAYAGVSRWNRPDGEENFYEWTAVADIDDSFYDGYREILGLPIPRR